MQSPVTLGNEGKRSPEWKKKMCIFFREPDINSEEGGIATNHSGMNQVSSDGEL